MIFKKVYERNIRLEVPEKKTCIAEAASEKSTIGLTYLRVFSVIQCKMLIALESKVSPRLSRWFLTYLLGKAAMAILTLQQIGEISCWSE